MANTCVSDSRTDLFNINISRISILHSRYGQKKLRGHDNAVTHLRRHLQVSNLIQAMNLPGWPDLMSSVEQLWVTRPAESASEIIVQHNYGYKQTTADPMSKLFKFNKSNTSPFLPAVWHPVAVICGVDMSRVSASPTSGTIILNSQFFDRSFQNQ